MKKRILSLVLCLVMVFSLLPTFAAAAEPVDYGANGVITNPDPETDESGALNLTKTLAPGANGTYDITMESWATGEVKTQGITEKIPTDFVLVVDQSGSMDTTDMPTGTPSVQNNKYLEDVANGAYYYKDGDHYYRVYGVKDYLFRYYPANYWYVGDIIDRLGTRLRWFMGNTETTATFANQLYFRETVGDQTYYQPITMTVKGVIGAYDVRFKYNSKVNGETWFDRNDETYMNGHQAPWYKNVAGGGLIDDNWGFSIAGRQIGYPQVDDVVQGLYTNPKEYVHSTFTIIPAIPIVLPNGWRLRTGMYVNYPMYDRHVGYTKLCYRDVNGVEHEVASNQNGGQSTWEFCDDSGIARSQQEDNSARPTYSNLYTFATTTDRLTALKAALNEFAQTVANESDDFGAVDNRVSIVGFSSSGYNNTELLTKTDENLPSSTNGWQKDTCDGDVSKYYGKGLVASNNGTAGTVNPKITAAITAITANGGTQPEDGLNMAYQVLTNRSNTTYTIRSGDHIGQSVDRNTIVIFFTDGQPGDYKYSNQYAEANDVVEQAKLIKDYKDTTIFSIGVFGESDGNPLTYSANNEWTKDNQGDDVLISDLDPAYWEYLGGWMESYPQNNPQYCLRRQWRPNSASAADNYTAEPNDTIFDYMSVVSSNYPKAEQFIAPSWLSGNYTGADGYTGATDGVRHKEKAETTNKYYRMASDQDTLIAAFMAAVTMNNEETTTDTGVTLDTTAIFKDKVNLADFDTTGATYTVKWQPVKEENGQIVNNGNAETKVNGAAYPAEGINYSGFNYSANFVTSAHPGQKLVITINGLTPKKTVGELKSNDGNAGVYGPEDEDPTVSITSPTLQFPESAAKTYVIDFNAKMTVATDVTKMVGAENDTVTGTNGSFVKSDTNVTYQLSSVNQASKTAEINKAYTGVDTATVYGKLVYVENAQVGWNQITTVPASSVYYDDDFTTENAQTVTVGDGHGKIDVASTGTIDASGKYYFTFYGTGIDVYCTTDSESGYVSAAVFRTDDPTACSTSNRVGKPATVKNLSVDGTRYNTPTVSFTNLGAADTYTLMINANGDANYKLDGVRVYNPVKATDTEGNTTAAADAQHESGEDKTLYLNLHDMLINDQTVQSFSVTKPEDLNDDFDKSSISGVLFVDNAANLVEKSHYDADHVWHEEEINLYTTQFDAYKTNSPNNEIYLAAKDGTKTQAIAFQVNLNKAPADTMIYIGLSAPEGGNGMVSVPGNPSMSVNSQLDMYYGVTVPRDGVITIENVGDCLISITNLKVTNVPDAGSINAMPAADKKLAMRAFFMPVTTETVELAATSLETVTDVTDPQDPDTPDTPDQPDDPKPGWNDGMNAVQTILKNLFENLLKNLFDLFKGLGNW